MKISENNLILRLIRSTFGEYVWYPKDLCSFFWLAISSIIMFIPIFWFHIINFFGEKFNWNEHRGIPWFVKLVGSFILLVVSFALFNFTNVFNEHDHLSLLWAFLGIPVIMIGIALSLLLMVTIVGLFQHIKEYLDIYFWERKMKKNSNSDFVPKKYWLLEAIRSFKEKTCKIIQYEE